jgi:L-lysine exporter family protein LysE/ArgO
LLSLTLCLDLGIVNIAILRAGVERGFWAAFLIGVGSSFGDLIYAVLAVLGMTYILQQFMWLRWLLWLGGTLVLLYFAWHMLRSALNPRSLQSEASAARTDGRQRLKDFAWGLGLALSSPSAILWFATVGGSIVAAEGSRIQGGLTAFFSGFFTASVAWSLLAATVGSMGARTMGNRLQRVFSLGSAALFVFFAAKVFWHGFHDLAG